MENNKSCTLIRHLGMLSTAEGNQQKLISFVQWHPCEPSLDIRKWEGDEPKKGISLRGDEIRLLCQILKREFPEHFA